MKKRARKKRSVSATNKAPGSRAGKKSKRENRQEKENEFLAEEEITRILKDFKAGDEW